MDIKKTLVNQPNSFSPYQKEKTAAKESEIVLTANQKRRRDMAELSKEALELNDREAPALTEKDRMEYQQHVENIPQATKDAVRDSYICLR